MTMTDIPNDAPPADNEGRGPARCTACDLPMLTAAGCTQPHPTAHRYGDEPQWAQFHINPQDRCRDCGCQLGQHHHANCCVAWCTQCPWQTLFCDCPRPHGWTHPTLDEIADPDRGGDE